MRLYSFGLLPLIPASLFGLKVLLQGCEGQMLVRHTEPQEIFEKGRTQEFILCDKKRAGQKGVAYFNVHQYNVYKESCACAPIDSKKHVDTKGKPVKAYAWQTPKGETCLPQQPIPDIEKQIEERRLKEEYDRLHPDGGFNDFWTTPWRTTVLPEKLERHEAWQIPSGLRREAPNKMGHSMRGHGIERSG